MFANKFEQRINAENNAKKALEDRKNELRQNLQEIGEYNGWSKEQIEKYQNLPNLLSPAMVDRIKELLDNVHKNKEIMRVGAINNQDYYIFQITRPGEQPKTSRIPKNHEKSSYLMDGINFTAIDPSDTPFGNAVVISNEMIRNEELKRIAEEKENKNNSTTKQMELVSDNLQSNSLHSSNNNINSNNHNQTNNVTGRKNMETGSYQPQNVLKL